MLDDRIVCDCHRVSQSALRAAIDDGARTVEALGLETGAGTGCGQCQPALRRRLRRAWFERIGRLFGAG